MPAAADPPAQLVQLADAEPVGVHHHHHRRVGHVHPHLDHRGAHQHVDLPGAEGRHHRVLLLGRQLAVHEPQPQPGQRAVPQVLEQLDHRHRRRAVVDTGGLVGVIDAGGHHVGLPPAGHLLGHPRPGPVQPPRLLFDEDRGGGDGLAAAGKLPQLGGLQVAEHRQRHRARDRGGRHHQQVRGQTVAGLGAQAIPLLHPEAVLLVDDHQAEVVKFHGVLQQGVGADHDAGLPGGHLVAHLTFLRRRHRPGQQRHPGGALGPAELAGHPQRAEHVADRPGVLGGKDFRRRQQRALVAGVDHLQHRQHRDDGFAGAHLTLQQPVHRPGRLQFPVQGLQHRALPGGQLVRQPCGQRGGQAVVAARGGRAGLRLFAVPAAGQRPLHGDRLVEGQPLAGAVAVGGPLGEVDVTQRGVLGDQIALRQNVFGYRVGHRVEHGEHLAHAGVDVPALQSGAGRVDREEVALEGAQVQAAVLVAGGAGDRPQRRAAGAARRVEQQMVRVGELHRTLEVADLPGEHHPGALDEAALEVFGVEERGGDLGALVLQGDHQVLARRVALGAFEFGPPDHPDQGDVLTGLGQVVLAEHPAAVAVLARVVPQQVVDGADTQHLLQARGGLGADEAVEAIGQGGHRYSTPISRASPRCPVA